MEQPGWASDFALRYIGQDTEDVASESETDRDLDPDTWDLAEEFRGAGGEPTSDASIPFCLRAPTPTPSTPHAAPDVKTSTIAWDRRTAWRMLFRGIGGVLVSTAVLLYAVLQALYGIFAIAFIALCLYLLSRLW